MVSYVSTTPLFAAYFKHPAPLVRGRIYEIKVPSCMKDQILDGENLIILSQPLQHYRQASSTLFRTPSALSFVASQLQPLTTNIPDSRLVIGVGFLVCRVCKSLRAGRPHYYGLRGAKERAFARRLRVC